MSKEFIVFVLMAVASSNAAPLFNPVAAVSQIAQNVLKIPLNVGEDILNALNPFQGIADTSRMLITKAAADAVIMSLMVILPSPLHPFVIIFVRFLCAFIDALFALM